MGYYKVLSEPMPTCISNYKGVYRSQPFPKTYEKNRFMSLWQRYVQDSDKHLGITTELTIHELKEFADLATESTGISYEVIFISETFACPHQADYYGIDVTGGGYSMVGENFFKDSVENGIYHLYDLINHFFRARLNANGLFNMLEDAISFYTVLYDLTALSPGCVEQEDWHIAHVFKVV